MSFVDAAVARMPAPLQKLALAHRELVKFAMVGGTTFIVDTAVFYLLKTTVLAEKPVTAKIFAVLVATILSYVLNREWSFKARGGRETHHEAALFFAISAVGMGINAAPLWISSYVFELRVPNVTPLEENIADFISAQIIGTLLAMVFRWWAFRKFVFLELEEDLAAVEPPGDDLAEREAS
ncbi:GtrA family protein [Rhodococcus sp. X156]|uniref:GtrA family protein n=1 Tax=Rhodococcus sp. X156 TaxID=2499145 RepID=UPI000FDBE7F6|nr:GtrA family protein [Rhodococcus sp. X156]